MSLYEAYLKNIEEREKIGLSPKPIDSGDLINEIITNIVDKKSKHRDKSLEFLINNTLPGTTEAALNKANFLKDIILEKIKIPLIPPKKKLLCINESQSHLKKQYLVFST